MFSSRHVFESEPFSVSAQVGLSVSSVTSLPNGSSTSSEEALLGEESSPSNVDHPPCTTNPSVLHASPRTNIERLIFKCPPLKRQVKGQLLIGHLNVRSLNSTKVDQLHYILDKHNFDLFGISETWLSKSKPNSVVNT